MFDISKAVAGVEATRQLVTTLTPHLRSLAGQVRPLIAPGPRMMAGSTLGILGVGLVVGAGIGLLAAPEAGAEVRAKLKGWMDRRLSDAAAMRKRLQEKRHANGSEAQSEQSAAN